VKAKLHSLLRRLYFSNPEGIFWKLLELFLKPFVPFYRLLLFLDQRRKTKKRRSLPVPVISIGNISLGGTGKTSFAQYMLEQLSLDGYHPGLLKRGEGNQEGLLLPGNGEKRVAEKYGDEVALLSENIPGLPVGVGRDRWSMGRRLLEEASVGMLLLDDGFQHLELSRDLDIVLLGSVDEAEGSLLPAGPLRESKTSLERADIVSVKSREPVKLDLSEFTDAPVYRHYYTLKAVKRGDFDVTEALKTEPVDILSTLARPRELKEFLLQEGYQVRDCYSLPDHASIATDFIEEELEPERLVLTEKELVKLPPRLRERVNCLKSRLVVELGEDFWEQVYASLQEQPNETG